MIRPAPHVNVFLLYDGPGNALRARNWLNHALGGVDRGTGTIIILDRLPDVSRGARRFGEVLLELTPGRDDRPGRIAGTRARSWSRPRTRGHAKTARDGPRREPWRRRAR
jgi:hypothetical protein